MDKIQFDLAKIVKMHTTKKQYSRFSVKEKNVLYELFHSNLKVIDIKQRKHALFKQATVRKCWEDIRSQFNAHPDTTNRSMKQIQKFWLNARLRNRMPKISNSPTSSNDDTNYNELLQSINSIKKDSEEYDDEDEDNDNDNDYDDGDKNEDDDMDSQNNNDCILTKQLQIDPQQQTTQLQVRNNKDIKTYILLNNENCIATSSTPLHDIKPYILSTTSPKHIQISQQQQNNNNIAYIEHENQNDTIMEVVHELHHVQQHEHAHEQEHEQEHEQQQDHEYQEEHEQVQEHQQEDEQEVEEEMPSNKTNIKKNNLSIHENTDNNDMFGNENIVINIDKNTNLNTNINNNNNISSTTHSTEDATAVEYVCYCKQSNQTMDERQTQYQQQLQEISHDERMKQLHRQELELRVKGHQLKCEQQNIEILKAREELKNMKELHQLRVKEMHLKLQCMKNE